MTRRAPAVLVPLLAPLLVLLALVTTATEAEADEPSGAVVVIATGGITWSDVDPDATPNLWVLLRDGSSAALVDRSTYSTTCPVDGWLGLSAGARAAAPRPDGEGSPGQRPCPPPAPVENDEVIGWSEYVAAVDGQDSGARLGLLADEVEAVGMCLSGVGELAGLGAARADGSVQLWSPWADETLLESLNACPVTLVDVGVVRDPDDLPAGETPATASRAEQIAAVDAQIGTALEAGPDGADYVVASIADGGLHQRLQLLVARGPHYGPGLLHSASTRQPGLAQSADITATALTQAGIDLPSEVTGSVLSTRPAPDNSERRAMDRLRVLRDYDESSSDVRALVSPFFTALALAEIALLGGALLVWKRRMLDADRRRDVLRRTRVLAVIAGAVPAATFLANLVPWWRTPVELLTVGALVLGFAGLIALPALRPAWGRSTLGPLSVVALVTFAVLAIDVVTGSRLQLSSLMGLQPLVGGRFYGLGNPAFGLFGTAGLLVATSVASWQVRTGTRPVAALAVAIVGAVTIVIDAVPFWGADGGGPPALIPAFAFLAISVLGLRMTWRHAGYVLAGIAGTFLVVAGLDWLRATPDRSHLGRFVQSVIDGTAVDVLTRKAGQNWDLLMLNAPVSLLIPAVLVALGVLLLWPRSRLSRALLGPLDRIPVLRNGVAALVILWIIGFVLNDSGVAIPTVGLTLAVPLIASALITTTLLRTLPPVTTRRGRRRR